MYFHAKMQDYIVTQNYNTLQILIT